jgi:hypothetical protein
MLTHHSLFFLKLIVISMILVGCVVPLPTTQPVDIPTASPTSAPSATVSAMRQTNTPIPYLAGIPSAATPTMYQTEPPTPYPTRTPSDKIPRMIKTIQSKDCVLPCYLGITPGKTSLNDAKTILENFGGDLVGDSTGENGVRSYFYELWIVSDNRSLDVIYHDVTVSIVNEIVQRIEVSLQTVERIQELQNNWSRFSIKEIFLKFGAPDQIHVSQVGKDRENVDYLFILDYAKIGAMIEFGGRKNGKLICPQIESRLFREVLELYNPGVPWVISNDFLMDPQRWAPIDLALGMNKDVFYEKVLADSAACFSQIGQSTSAP